MKLSILNLIAPHYCCSCGEIGSILCDYCKFNIISEPYDACILCGMLASGRENVCQKCKAAFSKAWCVGERAGELKTLIDAYKFNRARAAHKALAELLHEIVPFLPKDTIITAVPTIPAHVRARGYDQAALLARHFAILRHLPYQAAVSRRTNTVQHTAKTKRQRIEQAKKAFLATVEPGRTYLLIDDVCTTGASLRYAAKVLKDAGAKDVWVAVLAKQSGKK
jgi:ComF family protein